MGAGIDIWKNILKQVNNSKVDKGISRKLVYRTFLNVSITRSEITEEKCRYRWHYTADP